MKSIRYSLHFPLLIVAMFVFWLAWFAGGWLRYRVADLDYYRYGVMGFLHATCIVVSLRDRKAIHPIIALSFVALAAVWSAVTPILGIWASFLWSPLMDLLPLGDIQVVFIFLTGSAIGAAGYWLLVRLFWLKSLRSLDCLRTVALCVAGTLLSSGVVLALPERIGSEVLPLILTAAWWFAFSLSLYWSEARRHPNASAARIVSVS